MRFRFSGLWPLAAVVGTAAAAPVASQSDSPELPPAAYEAVAGLYTLEDGRRLEIFDLVDQLRRNQLVAVEPGSGEARTLYPIANGATADTVMFEAGAAWFVREPAEYRIGFVRDPAGGVGVAWLSYPDGRTLEASRVRFREHEVTFGHDDVRLAGTLVLPDSPGPHPVIVMVHGSGPLTRRVPRYMAELFAHRGVGALVYDKRGTGESTGEWRGASHAELADDVEAAVNLLVERDDVDPARIGLFGSSEGGYVAPVVAARNDAVSLLVCRVCPALPQHMVAPVAQRSELERRGFDGADLDDAIAFHRRLLAYAVADTGYAGLIAAFERWRDRDWMARYGFAHVPPPDAPYWGILHGAMTVDPREHYAALAIPVLVVLGELDERIRADEHSEAFLTALREGDSDDFRVEVLENATHGLLVREPDAAEDAAFERFAPAFHDLVVDWVAERFLGPAADVIGVRHGRRRGRTTERAGPFNVRRR